MYWVDLFDVSVLRFCSLPFLLLVSHFLQVMPSCISRLWALTTTKYGTEWLPTVLR